MLQHSTPCILVVDDDKEIRCALTRIFSKEGYQVAAAASGEEALALFQKNNFNLVITDLRMPGIGGLELLKKIKTDKPETVVIILTAFCDEITYTDMKALGAYTYLCKPIKKNEMLTAVKKALLPTPGYNQPYSIVFPQPSPSP
jgi:two-component system response regulator PilR (NtrC family)